MGYRYAREIRSQIDQICNAFWSGGISNPLEVIEQSTYLLFLRRLDELETLEERKATQRKPPMERRIFPAGEDRLKRPYDQFRWSRLPVPADAGRRRFHFCAPPEGRALHHPDSAVAGEGGGSAGQGPMEDRDTKVDIYEYMLGKIAEAGRNGQFRTPRGISRPADAHRRGRLKNAGLAPMRAGREASRVS